jgi:two-component system OmpR family response regulator
MQSTAAGDGDATRVVMRRADGSPIHVLVVDDEPVLAELVSMALRYEGCGRPRPTWWCWT